MKHTQTTHIIKGLYLGLVTTLLICTKTADAEIVFNGNESYSTHTGVPQKFRPISMSPPGTAVKLLDLAAGQIDYTNGGETLNRSAITDAEGMVIEAEGLHTFTRNDTIPEASGFINICNSATGGNRYALGCLRKARFSFPVQVLLPGSYSFALDGAYAVDNELSELKLYTSSDGGNTLVPAGSWTARYNTGNWQTIQQNLGGSSASTPFSLPVVLDTNVNTLVFEFTTERAINIDRFRVTKFSEKMIKPGTSGGTDVPVWIIILVVIGCPATVLLILYLLFMKNR